MTAVETPLPRSATAPARARRIVDDATAGMAPGRRAQARLLTSELVSNAVRHGAGRIAISVHRDDDALTVAVSDEGDGRPRLRADSGEDGGFGLHLVAALADRWGFADGSTHVWFALET
jgi:two-component sensor histidine kinase